MTLHHAPYFFLVSSPVRKLRHLNLGQLQTDSKTLLCFALTYIGFSPYHFHHSSSHYSTSLPLAPMLLHIILTGLYFTPLWPLFYTTSPYPILDLLLVILILFTANLDKCLSFVNKDETRERWGMWCKVMHYLISPKMVIKCKLYHSKHKSHINFYKSYTVSFQYFYFYTSCHGLVPCVKHYLIILSLPPTIIIIHIAIT